MSSAGNTRGLIEAPYKQRNTYKPYIRLPRGIPAASLKQGRVNTDSNVRIGCLPRGIPAASLKLYVDNVDGYLRHVFRGEYPRPH